MKKLFFLLIVIVLMPLTVSAEMFYVKEPIKVAPIFLDKISEQSYRYFMMAYRNKDDGLVYCVDPERELSLEHNYYYVEENQWETLNINKDEWRKIELLSYFGYGYDNHTDDKWAAITQYMIWQMILPDGWFLTFTNGFGGEFNNIYEKEINEIEGLVTDFETLPSFENETFKITKNNKLILKDKNNVLNNYKLVTSELNVIKKDNELIIDGTKNGVFKLDFVRGSYKPTKLYLSSNNQSVISTDGEPEKRFSITVIVESGSITINRVRNAYLNNDSTVENAIYEIIDSEGAISIIKTGANGKITLLNLPTGEVTIKEIAPSKGYERDKKVYKGTIINNTETIINIYPKLMVKRVTILSKYLDEETNLITNQSNSIFSILKDNEMKLSTKTNSFGKLSFILPYGNYIIKQNTCLLDYKLSSDYEIFIEDKNEETIYFINYKEKDMDDKTENAPEFPEDSIITEDEVLDEQGDKKPVEEKNDAYEDPRNNEKNDSFTENQPKDDIDISKENILKDETKNELPNINEEIISETPEIEIDESLLIQNSTNLKDEVYEKEENITIDNPQTNDNILEYLSLLLVSAIILRNLIQKM